MYINRLISGEEITSTTKRANTFTVRNAVPLDGCIEVVDKSGVVRVMDYEQIRLGLSNGTYVRSSGAGGGLHLQQVLKSEKIQTRMHRAVRVLAEIERLQKQHQCTVVEATEMFNASDPQNPKDKISAATVYRYIKRKLNGLPLIDPRSALGNPNPRLHPEVYETIRNHLVRYLQPNSPVSIREVTRDASTELALRGLLPQHRRLTNETVRRVLAGMGVDAKSLRLHPRERRNEAAVATRKIVVRGLLDRVEFDSVHVPIWMYRDAELIKDLWLVLAVDCATSQTLGVAFSIGPPSASTALQALKSCFTSKIELCQRYGVNPAVDAFGVPRSIVTDNGAEFDNARFRNAVRLLSGVPIFLKSNDAPGKPFVERKNGLLKAELASQPGSTSVDGLDGQRDPLEEGDELMQYDTVVAKILTVLFVILPGLPHTGMPRGTFIDNYFGGTSADAWRTRLKRECYSFALPPTSEDWEVVSHQIETRKLSRTHGVAYGGFEFRGDALPVLIQQHGETDVTVLVDPEDYRTVHVYGKDGVLRTLVNSCVDSTSPALSFKDAMDRIPPAATPSIEALRGRKALADDSKAGVRKNGRQSKRTARTKAQEDQLAIATRSERKLEEAIKRAADNPLPVSDELRGHGVSISSRLSGIGHETRERQPRV